MQKNTAGQKIGAQMVSATDGSAFAGAVTVYVCGDAGTQAAGSVGSGACTHEGNGFHTYAPATAETNYTVIAFTFIGSGAVPATVQVFTSGFDVTAAQIPANTTHLAGQTVTAGAGVTFPTSVASPTNITAGTITTVSAVTGLTAADVGAIKTKTDFLPSVTAGGSGGLMISGTNAGTTTLGALTITGATTHTGNVLHSGTTTHTGQVLYSDGIAITGSTAGRHAIAATGNAAGAGMILTGGNAAPGLYAVASAMSGIMAEGAGSNKAGIECNGPSGLRAVGSVQGILATSGTAAGIGIVATGNTSGVGLSVTGGNVANGATIAAGGGNAAGLEVAGTGTGSGLSAHGAGGGTGHGILATSGSGATGDGINATAASTAGSGLKATGTTTGAGWAATGGTSGPGALLTGGGNHADGDGLRTVAGGALALDIDSAVLAEIAKIPKSDAAVTWNATALASINAEVDTALNTAVPASNTANSVNDLLLDQLTPELAKVPKSDSNVTWNSTALASINAEVVDVLVTDVVADSIPADGNRPTIAQALYLLTQFMCERSVTGTTMTVYKPNGTTALLTLTLNDATSPTAVTRTT